VDVIVSATFQSSPAEPLQANWTVSSAIVAQTLGRDSRAPRRTSRSTCWLRMMRGARVNQLAICASGKCALPRRSAPPCPWTSTRSNADTVLTYNQAFTPGGAWLVPTTVLTARTAEITVQYDF
jgi:hypothetical protein